jgi:AcrR family transcriptional regulator
MDQKIERGQATRQHIVLTATRLFTEEGYEGTSIELVLKTCGISRGALYHHFASKEALFTAVLEAAEARVAETIATAAQDAANPLDALRSGCAAWLQLARDPTIRRVVLIDAPSVVGWQTWREIDSRHGLGLLKTSLGMVASAGRIRAEMVDIYSHMLLAALIEMALLIARSEDGIISMQRGQEAVEQLVSRLVGVEPNGLW